MNAKRKSLLIAVLIPLAVGALSAFLTRGEIKTYISLVKPPLAPPAWLFPVVWTILYVLMGVASWIIWKESISNSEARDGLVLYAIQLFFNFFWSIIFFNWKQYLLAFIWLLGLILLIWSTQSAFRRWNKTAANLLIPYLLWCFFAGYLNLMTFLLN